jgi:predicted transcriptional regulator
MAESTYVLDEKASQALKSIAKDLGISESEVLRKGLIVMGLYAKLKKEKNKGLLLKDGENIRELILVKPLCKR